MWKGGIAAFLAASRSSASRSSTGRRAFTLVETLLAVAIIGVLASLMLPAIGQARDRARATVDMANLRSHVGVFGVYANDWKDSFPYFTDPRATRTIIRTANGSIVQTPFFGAHAYWNYALADGYYGGDPHHPSLYSPRIRSGAGHLYYYGCSFIASPQYWNLRFRVGPSQLAPTFQHQVTMPGQKSLFVFEAVESTPPRRVDDPLSLPDPQHEVVLGMTDGSARTTRAAAVRRGVESGDGNLSLGWHNGDFPSAIHTLDGVRGRDIE